MVKHPDAQTVFPEVKLIDFDTATRDALAQLHPALIERVWEDGRHTKKFLKHEGFFILHREAHAQASREKVFESLMQLAAKKGWQVESQ